MHDTAQAFVEIFTQAGTPGGPLSGLTFAAKDIFDIAGRRTGCGNPDWARTHPPAETTAPAVQALLRAGADLVGKTHSDELAYSLIGANAHYGTPLNSAAPERVPGGSSSGSAAAVAAGLCDIGLGSDTGGSVRAPASFCGLYGIRTSHARIPLTATMPLAPSFDTVGWFARDAETFARAGTAFGVAPAEGTGPQRLLIADDAMAAAGTELVQSLAPAIAVLQERYGGARRIELARDGLAAWRETFRVCQAAEIWAVHGDWITRTRPAFGPGVAERFKMAAAITPDMHRAAATRREAVAARMRDLLGDDALVLLPTCPDAAPLRDADQATLDTFRNAALDLLCPAGLAGLPQISIPAGSSRGAPAGLGVIAGSGGDDRLIAVARDLATV